MGLILDEEDFEKDLNLRDMNVELNDKMQELKKSSSIKDHGDNLEIKYHGMVIPIKNEKTKSLFIKIDEISQKIEKEGELNKKIAMFSEISNNIDEINKLIKRDKIEENPNQSESKI